MRVFLRCIRLNIVAAVCGGVVASGQDFTNLGGALTSSLPDRNAIQVAAPNVVDPVRRAMQLDGFSVFHRIATPESGLGPLFNHRSCGSCHVNNGRGPLKIDKGLLKGTSLVVKVSRPGLGSDGAPRPVAGVGTQLRDHSTSDAVPAGKIRLRWRSVPGKYPDGTTYTLRRPVIRIFVDGKVRRSALLSLRMTPPIIGPGLLESIAEETVLEWSDQDDSDGDGISGRPQYVPNIANGLFELGRFGFKGSHPTLEQQSAAAAFFDIGVTSKLFQGDERELGDEDLELLRLYQGLAGVPRARDQSNPEVIKGKELFLDLGCASCHRFDIVTRDDVDVELRSQLIHPFTDLLLHDMGPGLADRRPEYQANGREWRTTPLWGIGFARSISNTKLVYLHDGRARTLEEAILWHGGEAEKSLSRFKALSSSDRARLIRFLKSL